MLQNPWYRRYRALLLFCACYFLAVAVAHQTGWKVPLLFIFYAVPSERYQDLIISFLAFGWSVLFIIGWLDRKPDLRVQALILGAAAAAVCGLVRTRLEVPGHAEIDFEIAGFAILLAVMITLLLLARRNAGKQRQ